MAGKSLPNMNDLSELIKSVGLLFAILFLGLLATRQARLKIFLRNKKRHSMANVELRASSPATEGGASRFCCGFLRSLQSPSSVAGAGATV
jgi:hypothetical protein